MATSVESPARAATPRRRGLPVRRQPARRAQWIFIAPAAALFLLFFAYPLLASLYQSFETREGGVDVWAGLSQYRRLLHDPLMGTALFNAGLILVVQVPLMICLGLVLAQVLNQSWLRFRTTLRISYFLPAVTTLVAYSVVFRVLLKTDGGVANQVLTFFHLQPIDWLNDPVWARVALIGSVTWRWTGYNMVILLAGLQAIPREQYEAAALDGASDTRTFVHVVLPQLKPVILFCAITSTIGTLQLFDENYILTGGGPDNATLTPVLYLYRVGFQQLDFGYASAIAWVLVAIIAIISLVQWRFMGGKES